MDFQTVLGWFNQFTWQATTFLVVLGTLTTRVLLKVVLDRVAAGLHKTATPLDEELLEALRKPLSWSVWIFGILFAVEIPLTSGVHAEGEVPAIFDLVGSAREIAAISLLVWAAFRSVGVFEQNTLRKRRREGASEEALKELQFTLIAVNKVLRASILITGLLVALHSLGVSVEAVLAFGGVGGIAVGFAARDMLANFFGTVMLFLDKPFTVGDWIRSDDREVEGTVENIGWRVTMVRTFDKRPLYIPNATFSSMIVENPSRMLNRRIFETLGVRYDDVNVLPGILKDIREMLATHRDIDTSRLTMVYLNEFSESSVDFFIYTFTKTTDWNEFHSIKENVLFQISEIVARHGAELAFPTQTQHIASLPAEALSALSDLRPRPD